MYIYLFTIYHSGKMFRQKSVSGYLGTFAYKRKMPIAGQQVHWPWPPSLEETPPNSMTIGWLHS